MSEALLDLIDQVIHVALDEDVKYNDLRMAIHDRYIDLNEAANVAND